MAECIVCARAELDWRDSSGSGIQVAAVRRNDAAGAVFGMVHYETGASTGLHQHRDIASAFILSGALCDYTGFAAPGTLGISLPGATHDTTCYAPSTFVARLEGPVVAGGGQANSLYGDSASGALTNPAPGWIPHRHVDPLTVPAMPVARGVQRRVLYDYGDVARDGRCVELRLLPGSRLTGIVAKDWLDLFLCAGDLQVAGHALSGGGLASVPAELEIDLASDYGALLYAWTNAAPSLPMERFIGCPLGFDRVA